MDHETNVVMIKDVVMVFMYVDLDEVVSVEKEDGKKVFSLLHMHTLVFKVVDSEVQGH